MIGQPERFSDALRRGRERLTSAGARHPGLDAEVLLRHVLGIDRTALFVRLPEQIAPEALAAYDLLEERACDIPVAYLTGERGVYGFGLSRSALACWFRVPRRSSWCMGRLHGSASAIKSASPFVDVGTGSGAIAISIAAAMGPDWQGRIIASDISRSPSQLPPATARVSNPSSCALRPGLTLLLAPRPGRSHAR